MNPLPPISSTNVLIRHLWVSLLLVIVSFPAAVQAQLTGTIVSFGVTNYQGYIAAGDTNSGGRQAIQTSTVMFYTNSSHVLATNVFQMVYQLLDGSNNPVPILDEKGNSNTIYSVYQTNALPIFIIPAYSITNNASLQPLTRLSPYVTYTPQLKVYSSIAVTNPAFIYTGQSSNGTPNTYFDFTNTVSPDVSPNIEVVLEAASLTRTFSISNSPGQYGFPVGVGLLVGRYDDFTLPPSPTNTTVTLNFQLINTTNGQPVPLQSSQAVFNVNIESHDLSSPPAPVSILLTTNFLLIPSVQLDSVDNTYQVIVTVSHTEGLATVSDYTNALPATQLLDFNGQLFFGPLLTYFTNLDFAPNVTATVPGDHLDCVLTVSTNAGLLPGAPGYNYGNDTGIGVIFLTNGTAQIKNLQAVVLNNQPALKTQTSQNISFQTTPPVLTSAGASESVTLILPAGFSVATGAPANHLMMGSIPLGTISLNSNLAFQTNVLAIPGPFQAVEESLPFLFQAPSIQWAVNSGSLTLNVTGGTFARQTEDDLLIANRLALSDANTAFRVSNDGYFRNATAVSNLVVAADANGIAKVSCQLALNPPELRPHFPYANNQPGSQMQFTGNGSFVLQNGAISPASFLPVFQSIPATYARDISATNCASSLAGPAVLPFTPVNGQLKFTADGGLLASGSVPTTNLTWGYLGNGNYAQEVMNVGPGNYEMAGTFLAGGQSSLDPTAFPAVLLSSGFGQGTNPAYLERPGGANYNAGLANYPGVNFIAPANGASFLAGQTLVNFALAPDSKYYARAGGVTGIHDAVNFPSSTLMLYGYSFTFSSYRLSFLDTELDESLTVGAVSFPTQPSGFIQQFSNLRFSGQGYLESADVPPSSGSKHLNYWNADITPESIQFQPSKSDPCGTSMRWLVLGVETTLPFIPQKLHASLGFQPTGNLVTAADNVNECDSRFAVPAQLSLQGPGSSFYVVSTASEGYFNNWTTANAPQYGFYNLAGKVRVPFFEDVKVHLHIQPLGGNNAQISIMGGWPDPDSGATDEGWTVNGNNYFNTAKFDAAADGFPADQNVGISDYENSQSLMYHPVAQRNWIEVAVFNYPLAWDPVRRRFAGFQTSTVELPVINVDSNLKELSPGKVDLDFAQDISLQLPVVKVLDLINDALGEIDGPLQSITNALGKAIDTGGFNELQSALREDPTTLFQPILNSAFSNVVDQLYGQLSSFPQGDKQAFLTNAVYQVTHSALNSALNSVNGGPGQANSVVGQLDKTLTDAQGDLTQFTQILAKDSNGAHHAVSQVIQKLITDQAPPGLGSLAGTLGSSVDGLVSGLNPTLDELQSEFQSLSNQFNQVHGSLTNASGDFSKALGEAVNDTASAQQFMQMAAINVSNMLAGALTPAGDYFTANPAAAKQAIQQQLQNAFLSSQLAADNQQAMRQFLFDQNAVLDELMDATLDQINDAIRNALQALEANAADTAFQSLKNMTNGAGSGTLLSAKIRGAPTFNGDSLRKIHLNAAVQINVPNQMNFNAYMEIKELTSQSVAVDCIPAGDPAAEITLGAKNVKLDWPALNDNGSPLYLTVGAKWTLQDHNVIGIGGLFDIKGEIGFQGCSINELGASLAFGKEENYFAAKAAGTINILGVPVGVQAGVFVGRACSLDPLLFIDPLASDVLGANHAQLFQGIYVEAGASLSLSEILFGESSCVLDIGINESAAVYYEGNYPAMSLGMRQTTGVDASLLCLISASASLTTFDSVNTILPGTYNLTLGGVADICGSIGPCPFCISGCKSVTITGTIGTGGVSYHVDY